MSVKFAHSDYDLDTWVKVKHILSAYDTDSMLNTMFFTESKEYISVPLAFAAKNMVTLSEPVGNTVVFNGILTEAQSHTVQAVLEQLEKNRACIISSPPGSGKTIMALATIASLGLKTLIIINRVVLRKQWEKAITKFIPTANICFANIQHVAKLPQADLIVVDELHQNMSKRSFVKLMDVYPNYLLGLSATPYRYDIWDNVIPLFFGEAVTQQQSLRKHTLKIIYTNITFPYVYKYCFRQKRKTIDWTNLISQQSLHKSRNKFIVDAVLAENINYWLILCKRLEQIDVLYNLFESQTSKLIIKATHKTEYDKLPPCLILGTPSRLGVGFDMDRIEGLCLASDVMCYFAQYLGRLRKDGCLVLDFVDTNEPFMNHLKTRLATYNEQDCDIVEFTLES